MLRVGIDPHGAPLAFYVVGRRPRSPTQYFCTDTRFLTGGIERFEFRTIAQLDPDELELVLVSDGNSISTKLVGRREVGFEDGPQITIEGSYEELVEAQLVRIPHFAIRDVEDALGSKLFLVIQRKKQMLVTKLAPLADGSGRKPYGLIHPMEVYFREVKLELQLCVLQSETLFSFGSVQVQVDGDRGISVPYETEICVPASGEVLGVQLEKPRPTNQFQTMRLGKSGTRWCSTVLCAMLTCPFYPAAAGDGSQLAARTVRGRMLENEIALIQPICLRGDPERPLFCTFELTNQDLGQKQQARVAVLQATQPPDNQIVLAPGEHGGAVSMNQLCDPVQRAATVAGDLFPLLFSEPNGFTRRNFRASVYDAVTLELIGCAHVPTERFYTGLVESFNTQADWLLELELRGSRAGKGGGVLLLAVVGLPGVVLAASYFSSVLITSISEGFALPDEIACGHDFTAYVARRSAAVYGDLDFLSKSVKRQCDALRVMKVVSPVIPKSTPTPPLQPTQEPRLEPEPELKHEPEQKPEPIPQSTSQQQPEPEPEPVRQPTPVQKKQPHPEPKREPEPKPAPEPVPVPQKRLPQTAPIVEKPAPVARRTANAPCQRKQHAKSPTRQLLAPLPAKPPPKKQESAGLQVYSAAYLKMMGK